MCSRKSTCCEHTRQGTEHRDHCKQKEGQNRGMHPLKCSVRTRPKGKGCCNAEAPQNVRDCEHSIAIPPLRLILFGGPGPGGKAMASAPTLGLDAFCQKLVIWQDESGVVHVTFNDLLALADRQNVSGGLALQVINRRLKATFSGALEQ